MGKGGFSRVLTLLIPAYSGALDSGSSQNEIFQTGPFLYHLLLRNA